MPKSVKEQLRTQRAVLPSRFFDQIPRDLRRAAFTIKNIESVRVLRDILTSLEKARADGISFQVWKENLDVSVFQSEAHARAVFRTHMNTQLNSGKFIKAQENKSSKPYFMYNAILDDRTRISHRALHGIIRRVDDQFWNSHLPPNGFNCRCTVTQLSAAQAELRRRASRRRQNDLLRKQGKKALPSSRTISTSPAEIKHLRKNLGAKPDKGFDSSKTRSPIRGLDNYAESRIRNLPTSVRKDFRDELKRRDEEVDSWFNSLNIELKR